MTGVFAGKSLSLKYMSQMATAVRTEDLGASAIGVGDPFNRTFDLVIKTRPSAVRLKFVLAQIQRRIASGTEISALYFVVQQVARSRTFGTFVQDDPCFFAGQFIVFRCR